MGEEVRRVSLVPGAVSADFIQTGRRTKREERTPELMAHWTELKEGLAKTLIGLDIRQILQVHWSKRIKPGISRLIFYSK